MFVCRIGVCARWRLSCEKVCVSVSSQESMWKNQLYLVVSPRKSRNQSSRLRRNSLWKWWEKSSACVCCFKSKRSNWSLPRIDKSVDLPRLKRDHHSHILYYLTYSHPTTFLTVTRQASFPSFSTGISSCETESSQLTIRTYGFRRRVISTLIQILLKRLETLFPWNV